MADASQSSRSPRKRKHEVMKFRFPCRAGLRLRVLGSVDRGVAGFAGGVSDQACRRAIAGVRFSASRPLIPARVWLYKNKLGTTTVLLSRSEGRRSAFQGSLVRCAAKKGGQGAKATDGGRGERLWSTGLVGRESGCFPAGAVLVGAGAAFPVVAWMRPWSAAHSCLPVGLRRPKRTVADARRVRDEADASEMRRVSTKGLRPDKRAVPER